ncbi:MAG TPA: DegT/DnrJ/EryC1/StrS family aminotransferase [Bacteroidales bacterium]|nr:DegT/DnrJ/EryC1/StrS family aminotransferase [Bacteroidales bacterium]
MSFIPMVDLQNQYFKIKRDVDAGIQTVINNTDFIKGKAVNIFSEQLAEYLNVKHVIPCANGTDALQVAMMGLGLEPGDEVITTDFTFIATVEVIALLRLKPVLVDVDPNTFMIDPENVEKAITSRTKAIVPVHLFGQCAQMEEIMSIAEKYNLFVIEDTAQAIGADYIYKNGMVRKAGTIGTVGCTSFFPSKNLGCYGDGGALFTNDDFLAAKFNAIVNHGMVKRYYHEMIGVNSRLDSIQAAVLLAKLPHLDNYNKARKNAADYYDNVFRNYSELITPYRVNNSTHTFHQYTLRLQNIDRKQLMGYLKDKGIASAVYYPVPLHSQEAFKRFKSSDDDFPVTNQLVKEVLSLPMHTELNEDILKRITETVISFL